MRQYTIAELAERAGVTPRTIRYYTAEGLLPAPDTRGRYALYSDEHLYRLQLIARLKEAYLPLGEIKTQLDQLDLDKLQQLLMSFETGDQQKADQDDAISYISAVLAERHPTVVTQRLLHEARPNYQSAPPVPVQARLSSDEGAAQHTATPPGLLRRLLGQSEASTATFSSAKQAASSETWRRFVVAPGVELHMREPIAADLHSRIEQVLISLREILQEETQDAGRQA